MSILALEAPASATSPLSDAAAHLDVVREQQDHALTVLGELLALLPVPPSSFSVCSYVAGFRSRYGVTITMPLACTDLIEVRARIGGSLMVEACLSAQGHPYTRHELTGTHAGVPFEIWTNVYPKRAAVAA